MPSTLECGARASDDGQQRRTGSTVHVADDPPGSVPAVVVTPANEPARAPVAALAEPAHDVIGESVDVAFVEHGDTGGPSTAAAHAHSIRLEVVQQLDANRGFGLLPRRRDVAR